MITTAKIQMVLRQISQFDVAIANFYTKYKQLPGDTNLFPNPGDNNGLIEGLNSYPPNGDERAYFWVHLSQGVGLKNSQGNDYSAIFPTGSAHPMAANCPQFNLKQTPVGGFPCLLPYQGYNIWFYQSYDSLANGASNYDALIPADALAIDLKMDDGIPGQGKVRGGSWGTSGGSGAAFCQSGGWGDPYNVSNKTSLCALEIYIGLITGQDMDHAALNW